MTNLHKSWKMFQKQLKLCSLTLRASSINKVRNYYGNKLPTDSDTRNITSEKLLMASHQNIHLFAELTCWGRVTEAFSWLSVAVHSSVESDYRTKILFSAERGLRLSGSTETVSLRRFASFNKKWKLELRLQGKLSENSVTWRRKRIGEIYKYKCNLVKCFPLPKQWSYCLSLFFINLSAWTKGSDIDSPLRSASHEIKSFWAFPSFRWWHENLIRNLNLFDITRFTFRRGFSSSHKSSEIRKEFAKFSSCKTRLNGRASRFSRDFVMDKLLHGTASLRICDASPCAFVEHKDGCLLC